jgi:phosphomannomutase
MSLQEQYAARAARYREVRARKRLLGTFGFRGVVGDTMTADKAFRFGSALSRYLLSKTEGELLHPGGAGREAGPGGGWDPAAGRPMVVLAKDIRTSSDMLKDALASALTGQGIDAVDVGLLPPGGLSREIQMRGAHAGVMITASHNPPQYNGIKVMNGAGRGFSPEQDLELEGFYFLDDTPSTPAPEGGAPEGGAGKLSSSTEALGDYRDAMLEYVTGMFAGGEGKKVVVDGGGGNASKVTPAVLRDFGCSVVEYNCEYDGEFTLRPSEPTPENLAVLRERVVEEGADFGIGHDGDSDRTVFVDESGRCLQGDRTATFLLVELQRRLMSAGLAKPVIPVNVAFSNILEDVAVGEGFRVLYTPVGEPAIAEAMHIFGAGLGAEEMGSLVIRDWSWSREGPVLVPLMAGLLKEREMSMTELDASYPMYHQVKAGLEMEPDVFADVKDAVALRIREMDLGEERLIDIDGVRAFFDDGWFMVRASGTEPKFRVFSESKDEERAGALNEKGLELLRECME